MASSSAQSESTATGGSIGSTSPGPLPLWAIIGAALAALGGLIWFIKRKK